MKATAILWFATFVGPDPSTHEAAAQQVAAEYVQFMFQERDLEQAFQRTCEDLRFVDPTAEVWGGPAAAGVRGKEVFRQLVKSWQLERSTFDVLHTFSFGEHAVFVGELDWQAKGRDPVADVPFCTVLQIQGGCVATRTDFGDYDSLFSVNEAKDQALRKSAAAYLKAYTAFDLPRLEELVGEDIVLRDATAEPAAQELSGLQEYLAHMEASQARLSRLEFTPTFQFVSGTHAVFYGTSRALLMPVGEDGSSTEVTYAAMHVVQFKEGKVVTHRRFLDYGAQARPPAGSKKS